MPEKLEDKGFVANKMYDIKIKIKDLDYTNDTVEVIFTSSLSTAYQVIDITFLLDSNDVIIEEIFGGEPIKMTITLMREQDYPGPEIDVELLYLNSSLTLTEKAQDSQTTIKDRVFFTVNTIVRESYKTMSTLVNDVFIGTTLNDIISSLASDVGATIDYDTNGQNTNAIDQVCVPPMTLYKAIKEYNKVSDDMFDGYLDQRFGLFSGVPGVFCQYDNKIYIKNLTKKLTQNQTFTIYQLSGGESQKFLDDISDKCLDGDVFYTYDTITSEYAGNARFADLGSTINNIIKPSDSLYTILTYDLKTVAKTYSLLYSEKNKNLFIDSAIDRNKYYNEDTGYNDDETPFQSRYGRSLSDMSTISINLERNLPVLNLINVGEAVKFKPQTLEYQEFEGKYILWSSVISFQKQGPNWACVATINLIRTNKKN